jgi:diguanylate cyclase (GGDEF)-like protein/PAS domain S-box-containing protein
MRTELNQRVKQAARKSGDSKLDFLTLLKMIDRHYDKMEATTTQSLTQTFSATTPIEAILDSVTEALLSVNTAGVIESCNKVCSRYFGLPAEELQGSTLSILLPALGEQAVADFLAPYMSDVDATQVEFVGGETRAIRADGEVFDVEINASKLSSNKSDTFIVSLRDISARKRAAKTEQENEERYSALVDNSPEAIVVLDVETLRFCDANDNACELFNLSRARLTSIGPKAISPAVQPDGRSTVSAGLEYIDQTLDGGHPVFEWTHKDASGRVFPCEIRFSRLPDKDRKLIRIAITDISSRKRDDEQVYAQNKILEMIATNKPLDQTLRAICRCAEKVGNGMSVAVMLLDVKNQRLSVEEAPSLPDSFKLHLDLVPVAQDSLTCGVAVFSASQKFLEDIVNDAAWSDYSQEAQQHGIAAVWSLPVYGAAGRIIGTFDIYVSEKRAPTTDELDRFGRVARLAGIAVKRELDEQRLKNSEARYRGLFENVVDGVYIASRDGDIITANPALVDMLGYSSVQELMTAGRTTMLYVNPIDRERVFARLETEGFIKNFEYRLRCKDGSEIVVLENSRAIYNDAGNVVAHEGTISDITDRKIAETRVFEEKERAQVTLQSIADGVITTDAEGCIDYINPVAQQLIGCDLRSVRGKPIGDVMTIVNEHTRSSVEQPVARCLKEGRVISLAENSVLIIQDGQEIPIQDSAAPIRDRIGNVIGAVMVFHDIGKESSLFRQLSYQASHDAVTGLINRREFENQLVASLEKTHENPDHTHGLLYIDLDQFKVVNDTFGHTAGDELLLQVSDIIQANIRSTDIVARIGGDEFAVLLQQCDRERAREVAEVIRIAVEEHRFDWQDAFTHVRCSIGVVMVTHESSSVGSIMSSADVACYSAKDMGRNKIHMYQDSDAVALHEEMKWVSRITSAIDEERFELFFQPIVGIGNNSNDPRGHYELLLRMRDENGDLVQPDQFIPAAERYNMMSTLDRWVVHETLSKLADRKSASGVARFTLAVNLSGTSLSEESFLDYVISELQKYKLPEGAICFEITETAAISNLSRVIHFMQTLKTLGCKFSLDDFGSGLSSFTYLKNLPVDFLKIDGQFVQNVTEDSVDESMVKAINDVGRAMGIEAIAERVETKEVMDKLGELGIAYAQGYYIARPASVDEFEPWGEAAAPSLIA